MTTDIFEFWSAIADDAFHHPADAKVFEHVRHRFERDCLPAAWVGPLRTAPVVLLFLSPGYSAFDAEHATTPEGQAFYRRQRSGTAPLPLEGEHGPSHRWWSTVVRQFGVDPARHAASFAILNIGSYHSEKFHDPHMLAALPSSRANLDWAQAILFPQAEAGDRVVVCLRSNRTWGLGRGMIHGESLFVPECTPRGIMHRGQLRDRVVEAVQKAVAQSPY